MPLRRLPCLALFLLGGPAFAQVSPSIPADARKAMDQLSKEPFRAHMAFLADDLLEGRGTGTRGQELAARYVAAQFEALGLTPAGTDSTFYQRVPLREATVVPEKCSVTLTEKSNPVSLKWGDDFIMSGNSVREDSEVEAPVIFVGYGVTTPKVDGKKLSDEYVRLHYHAPSDDMSQAFDFDASVQFMQINFLVGYDVAQTPQRPTWNQSDFFGKTFGHP